MKISKLVSITLMTLGAIAIISLGWKLYLAMGDMRETKQVKELSEATTQWVDGAVALSLERSVTQVALAIKEPTPKAYRDIILEQRQRSDQFFEEALTTIRAFEGLRTKGAFLDSVRTARAQVEDLREEVDRMLALPMPKRSKARSHDLPYDLKNTISYLRTLADYLQVENDIVSHKAIALTAIRNKAWEIREFGGRARTYYAIATLNKKPIPAEYFSGIIADRARAKSAWHSIQHMQNTIYGIDAEFLREIEEAGSIYFDKYADTLTSLNAAMADSNANADISYNISFEQFFELSNQALGGFSGLSSSAGKYLMSYYEGRYSRAVFEVIGAVVALILMVAVVLVSLRIIRSRISKPIEEATTALVAVANGDLNRKIECHGRDVAEVVALSESLNELTAKLKIAEDANEKRLAEQNTLKHVITSLSDGLRELSQGNLAHQISGDDFGEAYEGLKNDFNNAMENLQDAMHLVIMNASNIENAVSQASQSSDNLARRTENQAATLEQTAAAMEEMNASIQSTAKSADIANQFVSDTRKNAEESEPVIQNTVDAMQKIKSSSEQISQIINVIDDIAFQTNLLALNAGVEAARAGEAGRGFAVVASEVRALASRSSEAAKEINSLIATSAQHVENGVDLVGKTGSSLRKIIEMIATVSDQVTEISSATKEQSTGISEISSAITQLDQVTQQNAAMVEETTAANHELKRDADQLSQLVAKFSTNKEPSSDKRSLYGSVG